MTNNVIRLHKLMTHNCHFSFFKWPAEHKTFIQELPIVFGQENYNIAYVNMATSESLILQLKCILDGQNEIIWPGKPPYC